MIATLLFSAIAALAVWLCGKRDHAHDPRFTALALGLLAVFPFALLAAPKIPLLPAAGNAAAGEPDGLPWKTILIAIWLGGVAVSLFRLWLAGRELARWRRRAEVFGCSEEGIPLLKMEGLGGPFAAGLFRPVVFVPTDWETWNEETRSAVLLHELEHHRRHDPPLRWLAACAKAVHWFNPLVHWMARRFALQCELACDRQVVDSGIRPDRYARLLCDLAQSRPLPEPALAMAGPTALETRVKRLMRGDNPGGFISVTVLGMITLASAAALALLGEKAATEDAIRREAEIRANANPFPGDS